MSWSSCIFIVPSCPSYYILSLADRADFKDCCHTFHAPCLHAFRKYSDREQTRTLCTSNVLLPKAMVRSEYSLDLNRLICAILLVHLCVSLWSKNKALLPVNCFYQSFLWAHLGSFNLEGKLRVSEGEALDSTSIWDCFIKGGRSLLKERKSKDKGRPYEKR